MTQPEKMTIDQLRAELKRLEEELSDMEDVHAFTFVKTSVHIGAEKAQNMQEEYEQERRDLSERIEVIRTLIGRREQEGGV